MSELNSTFAAHAFNADLGSEVVEGIIVLDRWALHFQSDELTLEIPVPQLKVEMGEGDDERIYFTDPAQPGWKIYTDDFSVLENRQLAQVSVLRDQLSNQAGRQELTRRLKITGWFFGICALIFWLGWVATGLMVRSLVNRIPPEWEQKTGDAWFKELSATTTFIEDTNQIARVTALAAPLTRVLPSTWTNITFHIADDSEPNAFAMPGGHIIINSGLLKMLDRPEELLGVLAHETAHVSEKHAIRGMISAAGPFLIFGVFLGGNGVGGLLAEGSGIMVIQGFSQEFETEADEVGWKYLVAANIDPRGLIEAFKKFKAYEAKDNMHDDTPQAFQSHPALDKRIARLEKKWKKLSRKTGFQEIDAAAFQALKPKEPAP